MDFVYKNQNYKYIGYLIVLLYLLPLILLREDAYIQIFDNLDSEFIYRLLLKKSDTIYSFNSHDLVPQMMNGIPRSFFASGINLLMVLIYFFDDILTAYIIHSIIVHSVAYWGMYLLVSQLDDKENYLLRVLASLCFALLPFQTLFGLSIAGIPLIAYAVINLIEKQRLLLSYFILFSFPFCVVNILILPFVLMTLGLVFIYQCIVTKRFVMEIFWGGVVLLMAFLVVDFQMILSVFDSKYQSHRYDFHLENYYPSFYSNGIIFIIQNFIHHNKVSEFCLQLGVNLAAIGYLIKYKRFSNPLITRLYIINIIIIIFWAINMSSEFHLLKNNSNFLKAINWSRFSFLLPASWYVLFFFLMKEFYAKTKSYKIPAILGALQLFIILSSHSQVAMVYKRILGLNFNTEKEITYNQFYSPQLFRQIKEYIGKEQSTYRVANVGFYPSIALFNGFYTLDNYQNNYLLSYKKSFRDVIKKELEKSPEYKKDFDSWGHFCMISSSELPFKKQRLIPGSKGWVINNLEIDTQQLKKLGAQYIFSSVEIKNYKLLNLKYLRSFEDERSPWKVFLYELN